MLCESSLIFLTNVVAGLYKTYYVYAFLFLLLTISSVTVHWMDSLLMDTTIINILDKCVILFVFGYGIYLINRKKYPLNQFTFILITFLFCLVTYIYGYCNQCYCFDISPETAQTYHSAMHVVGSIGFHCMLL
jgi:peptidoglycan/LPS O-acetylase OafA/YrhL